MAALAAALLLSSCGTVGPNYQTPPAPMPPAFKEAPPDGWKEATPSDAVLKGKWWEIYNDPELNALEEQVTISNQNVFAGGSAISRGAGGRSHRPSGVVSTGHDRPHCQYVARGRQSGGRRGRREQ